MNIREYESKVREVSHFRNVWGDEYWVINQCYWYDAKTNTKDEAIAKYKALKGIEA